MEHLLEALLMSIVLILGLAMHQFGRGVWKVLLVALCLICIVANFYGYFTGGV